MTGQLKDWRGNYYEYGISLDRPCDENGCDQGAVLLPCNAEGDPGRCHHHGGIHRLDGGKGRHFCEDHGLKHLETNKYIALKREGR